LTPQIHRPAKSPIWGVVVCLLALSSLALIATVRHIGRPGNPKAFASGGARAPLEHSTVTIPQFSVGHSRQVRRTEPYMQSSRSAAAPSTEVLPTSGRRSSSAKAYLNAANHANPGNLLRKLPLSFEANQGQAAESVKFLARGKGYTLFLTGDEAVLSLRSQSASRRTGARSQPAAGGNWKLEIGNSKLETGKAKSEKRKTLANP
jgi:hypothetical protein